MLLPVPIHNPLISTMVRPLEEIKLKIVYVDALHLCLSLSKLHLPTNVLMVWYLSLS
eukprot:UN08373